MAYETTAISQKVKVFPYFIREERPLSELEKFKEHHRLQTFYHKGCVCVSCGIVGTRLIKGQNIRDGSRHWDVYSDDLTPLTVDHILPKSLGGEDSLENFQPMCSPCNSRKGNGLRNSPVNRDGSQKPKPKGLKRIKPDMNIVGMELWRIFPSTKGKNKKPSYLGVVDSMGINPHSEKPAIIVVGKKVSYYDVKGNLWVRTPVPESTLSNT